MDTFKERLSELEAGRFVTGEPIPPGPLQFGPWAVATDGYVMAAVERSQIEGEIPAAPERLARVLAHHLAAQPIRELIVSADALSRFAGVVIPGPPLCKECDGTGMIECDECNGSGSVECECTCGDLHERDCRECDGAGGERCTSCDGVSRVKKNDERSRAQFVGVVIDRRLLSKLVRTIQPSGEIRVSISDGWVPIRLQPVGSNDWLGLLMPMADGTAATVSFDKPDTWAA